MDVPDRMHRRGGPVAAPFVGRTSERATLAALIGSLPSSGGALLVRGEAGVGKTALLERAAADAGHARCLWVRGIELEMVLPCAAAAELLGPLAAYFGELPDVQRSALEVSMALAAGPPPSPLAVCAAVLGVLTAAGEERPLVVVVDDYQWVDPPSRQALLFAAQRLGSERVAMLFAVRDEPGQSGELDLPTIRLTGLGAADVDALANALRIEVAWNALAALVEQTGGNPLAVSLVGSRGLGPGIRSGFRDGFRDRLRVGHGLLRGFRAGDPPKEARQSSCHHSTR